jgi:hypothetical protein
VSTGRRGRAPRLGLAVFLTTSIHCGASGGSKPPGDTPSARDASAAPDGSATSAPDGGSIPSDGSSSDAGVTSPAPDASPSEASTGGPALAIGEWTDAPGTCPSGTVKVDITTPAQLASAARGESPYDGDPPATCYFIHDGTYATTGVVLYVLKGGVSGGAPRAFVGESRAGVVIHGRGNVEDGVSDVLITNLTFDLTGYVQSGAFNTLNLSNGDDITVDHVTFTGDCATGSTGGHIETNGTSNVLVDSCLIEKFGQCGGTGSTGHEDHGVYLASGSHIVLRNNVIRLNSSRGVQMYTQMGQYGTLDAITLERNRIYQNGHRDYEDGVVINSSGTGPITHVMIQQNLIYENYYSGVRFVGGLESSVSVTLDTFDSNGAGSTSASRSEINIDSAGGGAGTSIAQNVFNVGHALINDCYDGSTLGFSIGNNFVHGPVPSGAAANCVVAQTTGDPQFVSAATGNYHTSNPAAASYGAYAP